jgi:hypothetical protein
MESTVQTLSNFYYNTKRSLGFYTLGFFVFTLLTSCLSPSDEVIRVAIVDTNFCPTKLQKLFPKTVIKTNESLDCPINADFSKMKYHGQLVAQEFLTRLSPEIAKKVELSLYRVFSESGHQLNSLWEVAWTSIEQQKPKVVVMSVGSSQFARSRRLESELFIATGSPSKAITRHTKLWPQQEASKHPNYHLIGSYHQKNGEIFYNYHQLHKDQIDYFFADSSPHTKLTDTSLAAAIAGAKALNVCASKKLKNKPIHKCLELVKSKITLKTEGISMPTY